MAPEVYKLAGDRWRIRRGQVVSVKQAGFTLLEVMIAILILGVGLSTVFTLFPIGIMSVKQTVDGSRAAMLGATARSEAMASQVCLSITNSGAKSFSGHMTNLSSKSCSAAPGPFFYPMDMRFFPTPVYEYQNAAGVTVRKMLFDNRRMVPMRFVGRFSGGRTVNIVPGSTNRDADRIGYFLAGNSFAPWQIIMRVQGRDYLLSTCAQSGVTPTSFTVSSLGPTLPSIPGDTPFEVLIPVAIKEPPTSVPQEYPAGYAYFAGGDDFLIAIADQTQHFATAVVEDALISVDGDWFRGHRPSSLEPERHDHPGDDRRHGGAHAHAAVLRMEDVLRGHADRFLSGGDRQQPGAAGTERLQAPARRDRGRRVRRGGPRRRDGDF